MRAQITVTGASSAVSTCPNNGSISISATTLSPPLLYSLVAGPVTQPVQSNPVFNSLLPGTYSVKLTDGSGDDTTLQVTVTGTYINPDFTATTVKPYCVGDSNGEITGALVPGAGLGPFTWQLMAPSPVTAPPQANGHFDNLPAGNYTVRLADACGSYKTSVVTVANPNTQNPFNGGAIANKVGCDSMHFQYSLFANDLRLPLTFKYETGTSVHTYTTATSLNMVPGYCLVEQVVPGISYGEWVTITVYNACGDSTQTWVDIDPYQFYPALAFDSCGSGAVLSFINDSTNTFDTGLMPPVQYTLTDLTTNSVVDQGSVNVAPPFTLYSTYINGISTTSVDVGKTYRIDITDGCGETFTDTYTVPGAAPPAIINKTLSQRACIDSVAGLYGVETVGFTDPKMIITSGPAGLGSSKPGFEYTDTYTYPDTIDNTGDYWLLQNLAMGTYHFTIIDECGYQISDSIEILPIHISSLTKELSYKKGCLGQNTIYFGMLEEGRVTVTHIPTNTVVKVKDMYSNNILYNRDSVTNAPSGQYEVLFEYKQGGYGTPINDSLHGCWTIRDTIDIEDYLNPEISTGNAIMCNEEIHLVLYPDTSKGVPDYHYEIITGPQTFPEQASNVFTVDQPGTYTGRIYDACGNASIKQITVDTLSFDPIQAISSCNGTSLIFPSSLYDSYEWVLPNGQVHLGDSLIIDPITAADTGTYLISKVVDIDGCRDTLYSSYHVTLNPQTAQSIQFCPGTGVTVGGNTYTLPGTYTDTLTAMAGCDSIVVTHLTLAPQISDTTLVNICYGDSVEIAGQYHTIAGFYADSVQNAAGCYDLFVTNLVVNAPSDTVSASICWGTQYTFGGNAIGQTGTYVDTLSTTGCLSIVTLHLTVLPQKSHAFTKTICEGEQFLFGGNSYTTSGTYTDTIPTATCDSTVTVTLTVLPFLFNTPDETICGGDSLQETHLPNNPSLSYEWSPAQWTSNPNIHNPFLFPPASQVFQIIISNGICSDTLTKQVLTVPAIPPFGQTDSICEGQSIQIGPNPALPQMTYNWSPPDWLSDPSIANPIASPPSTMTYVLNAHALGNPAVCATADTVTLHVVDLDAPGMGYDEFAGCYGFSVQVNANGDPTYQYAWFTDDGALHTGNTHAYEIPYDTTVTFHLIVSGSGCTDTISVTKTFASSAVYWGQLALPNVFTPNNDQINDCFAPVGVPEGCYRLYAYNRWGVLVFDNHKLDKACWDGRYMATDARLVDGVYFWVMEIGGNEYHGTVTLAGGLGAK